jgi:2-C-methyl-D-erythritol 4-phosphate cytidylyltransferase
VRNALAHLPDGVRFVAVHDAARPLVSHALLDRLIATAMQYGTAIPALPVAPPRWATSDSTSPTPTRAGKTPPV